MVPELFNARLARQNRANEQWDSQAAEQAEKQQSQPGTTIPENMMDMDEQKSFNYDHPQRKVDEYSETMRAEACTTSPLAAFTAKPVDVFFDSQHKSEQVILMLRKHPITLVPKLLGAFFYAIFPLLTGFLGFELVIPAQFMLASVILWYLFLIGFLLETFLTWFFYVFIITDERIIDVDFLSLIYKKVTVAKIDNIEDVTATIGGAIRSIFNFGTVDVQTAGANAKISFEDVPQPGKVKQLLNELILEEEREKIEGRVN